MDKDWIKTEDKEPYEGQQCIVRMEIYRFIGIDIKEYSAIYTGQGVWLCDVPSYSTGGPSTRITHWKPIKEGEANADRN